MNNLSSYCGLVDTKIGASDKDLPVHLLQDRDQMLLKKIVIKFRYSEKATQVWKKNLRIDLTFT